MKILVIGSNGQLGSDLCQLLGDQIVIPLTHQDIDITSIVTVKEALSRYRPDIVINTAAYVRVDDCESNQDKAFAVNALGARNVAVVSQELECRLVHISTDFVFGGQPNTPATPYTEFDRPDPPNIYGKTKLAGEDFVRHLCWRHFIVRSSALFGHTGSKGKGGNFVETILNLAYHNEQLQVVNDQIISPTYTKDLAQKIAQLMKTEYYGIFHITNKGACSWYDFAEEILRQTGQAKEIVSLTSEQYPQKAKRANYTALDNYHLRLLGMDDMRPWQEALADYIKTKKYI